ncbi:hypothetical protein [Marinobacterium litorale]|uniref:hypothetical protein n=1 Tax=Marinobacterium litorale TaxID=404770 RepID=UPI0003F5934B|nr:hypothetical protein [Marinobacterium litorale]
MNTIEQKVHTLLELAMALTMAGKAQAFVSFEAHINGVSYHAYPVDQRHADGVKRVYLVDMQAVYMDRPDAEQRLDKAIAEFQALMQEQAA